MRKRPTLNELLDILSSPDILVSQSIESYNGGSCTVTTICPSKLARAIYGAPPKSEVISAKGKTQAQLEGENKGYKVLIHDEGRFATIREVIEFED